MDYYLLALILGGHVCFIIALVSFGVSQLSKITPKNIPDFPNWMADLFKVIYNLSPMFIGVTIFFQLLVYITLQLPFLIGKHNATIIMKLMIFLIHMLILSKS